MPAFKTAVTIGWILFGLVWLGSAFAAKERAPSDRYLPLRGLLAVAVFLLLRGLRGGGLAVHSVVLSAIGAFLFACGIALAIWARVHLGRNWGMPMTQKVEPELVTSGPYRHVRHPIYSGLLLALAGTALVTNLIGLIIVPIAGTYFVYSATVEERNLTATFPAAYPVYRADTKMLLPYLL